MYPFPLFAAAACFLGRPAVAPAATPPAPAATNRQNADSDARLLLGRANQERVRTNKSLLNLDPLLCKAALALARDRDAGHPLNNPGGGVSSNFAGAHRETAAYFRDAFAAGDKNKPAYERFGETVCHEPISSIVGKTKATLDAARAWEKWQNVPEEAAVCREGRWTAMGAAVFRSPRGSVCIVAVYGAAPAAPAAQKPARQKSGKSR